MMRVVAAGIPRPGWLVRSESPSGGLQPGPSTAFLNYQSLTPRLLQRNGRVVRWHTSSNYRAETNLCPEQGQWPLAIERSILYQDSLSQQRVGGMVYNQRAAAAAKGIRPGRLLFTSQRYKSEVRLTGWLAGEPQGVVFTTLLQAKPVFFKCP